MCIQIVIVSLQSRCGFLVYFLIYFLCRWMHVDYHSGDIFLRPTGMSDNTLGYFGDNTLLIANIQSSAPPPPPTHKQQEEKEVE